MKKVTGTKDTTSTRQTLAQVIQYAPLMRAIVAHKEFEKGLPKPTIPVVEPNELVGVEIEVEGILAVVEPTTYYWKSKPDGSLRNHGIEFASLPLAMYQLEYALLYLNNLVKNQFNLIDFSPRTSVHVHVNVRNMTWEEIDTLLLLYSIFERHFFHIVDPVREKSIFCVPLYRTQQLEHYIDNGLVDCKWHKYSALNCATILGDGDVAKYGTIEFRHMHGNMDPHTIINWCNSIQMLKKAAMDMDNNYVRNAIKEMNTTSNYWVLYNKVFGEYAQPMRLTKLDFELCITKTKLALFGRDWEENVRVSISSRYYHKYYAACNKTNDTVLKTLTGLNQVTHNTANNIFVPPPGQIMWNTPATQALAQYEQDYLEDLVHITDEGLELIQPQPINTTHNP